MIYIYIYIYICIERERDIYIYIHTHVYIYIYIHTYLINSVLALYGLTFDICWGIYLLGCVFLNAKRQEKCVSPDHTPKTKA